MKIIICLDNSSFTEKLLKAMQPIIGAFIAPEITILHIIDESLFYATTGAETHMNETLQRESESLKHLCQQELGANIQFIVEYGQPKLKIDELLGSMAHDLLIAGARSHDTLETRLLGGVSEHLLQTSRKPLLIIPVPKK